MTPNSRVHSVLRGISRRLPVLKLFWIATVGNWKKTDVLANRLRSLSETLITTRAELAASNEHRLSISRELSLSKAELAAVSNREARILHELSIAKAELVEFNDRENEIPYKMSIAVAKPAAANDRSGGVRGEIGTGDDRPSACNELLDDLTATKARLVASIDRGEHFSQRLSLANAKLAASIDRGEQLARELSISKAELAASNDRQESLFRELSIAKAELAALYDRANSTDEQLGGVLTLRDQLAAQSHLLLRHFADAQGHFTEAQNEYRRQLPMLTANLAALRSGQEDEFRNLRKRIVGSGVNPGTMAVDLYLDLLEAALTGTLYSDVSQSPWAQDVYDPARRAVGQDWPSHAETMIGTARMRNLRTLTQRALDENTPGDLIETGVWRGGACIYMRGILAAAGDTKRRVFVADSFRGLPPPDETAYPADAGDPHHTFSQLAISRADVAANFRRYGLLDDQVIFLEGWFKDTLPTAPIDQLAVLRLDGDMYESTMDTLNALYGKVSPGGFVIVDDYVLKACEAAVQDFRKQRGISAPMHEVDGAAMWWQVPIEPNQNAPTAGAKHNPSA
jgi:O-methyltransferase